MRYASQLVDTGDGEGKLRSLPPVHLWDPPFCGDINLKIASDGTWFYEGTPIGRAKLVRLFSTVLKKEGDDYFLVTPVEKLGIQIEDAPFLAVLCGVEKQNDVQIIKFQTNVGDEVIASKEHPLDYRDTARGDDQAPYVMVRGGLEAKIGRSVFYELVEYGETRTIDGREHFGVMSSGLFFPFGLADDIFGS